VVTPSFYVIKWKWQTYSACHQFFVLSKSYLDCILAVPKEGCHRRFKPCCNTFCCSKRLKSVFLRYHLQCSFKIFITVFNFLYVKANSKEIGEEILFPYFFRKMLMSAFLLRFNADYLEKNAWLPLFFFLDSNSFCKDLLFVHGPNLAQKPPYLVGTALKG